MNPVSQRSIDVSRRELWRYCKFEKEMNPRTIDWKRWLEVSEGLSEDIPFDHAVYKQWGRTGRSSPACSPISSSTVRGDARGDGLRFPARVVGAGGVSTEPDTRDVPDVATVSAGSTLRPEDYQTLGGPWVDGKDPVNA